MHIYTYIYIHTCILYTCPHFRVIEGEVPAQRLLLCQYLYFCTSKASKLLNYFGITSESPADNIPRITVEILHRRLKERGIFGLEDRGGGSSVFVLLY
jgi:hypothetical protein